MQWDLLSIQTWFKEVRLLANHDKTELVVFTRKRKLTGFFEPHFFGVTLSCSRSDKDIGVNLDSRLTWTEHVDVKMRKDHNLLWA